MWGKSLRQLQTKKLDRAILSEQISTCRARNRAKARIQAAVGTVALRRCCASVMLRRPHHSRPLAPAEV